MKVDVGPYPKGSKRRRERVSVHRYDLWSLDHTLALVILPALEKFRTASRGSLWGDLLPADYSSLSARERTRAEKAVGKQQHEILGKMITAFELIVEDCTADDSRIQEGLDLFAKYYRGLWL